MGRMSGLAGFGPKQARSLWQCMGVTQYEIPLDSRIADWVRSLPSPFPMDPKRLYAGIASRIEDDTHPVDLPSGGCASVRT